MKSPPTMGVGQSGKSAPITRLAVPGKPIPFEGDRNYSLVLDHTNVAAAESFAILRSRLMKVQSLMGIRSVLITSGEGSAGKTLIALNLALSFGQLGQKRTLLVDGDLRAGGGTQLLRLQRFPGLAEYLRGLKPYEAIIHPTTLPCLNIAPCGAVPEKALPEMLEGKGWQEMMERAKQEYDLVIVDGLPAAAPVADLELLAAACDACLVVVRMRKTPRASLSRVLARLDQKKLLGVVINNADAVSEYDYEYNYYYRRNPVR